MSLKFRALLRTTYKLSARKFSTLSAESPIEREELTKHSIIHTEECNPLYHKVNHLNKIYTVPKTAQDVIYPMKDMPKLFQEEFDIFGECFCLIRQPAIEIISFLRQTDYSKPINKYILYGTPGNGKTRTLLHLLHYAYEAKFITLFVPWAQVWYRFPKELTVSEENDLYDLPFEGANWLQLFKKQNNLLLNELNITLSKDYTWSQRESATAGSSLLSVIDFGITRVKYACQVVQVLIDELKLASIAGKCKVFVAIDGVNAFFNDYTAIRNVEKVRLIPSQISLTKAFTSCIKADWCNGAAVLIVDRLATKTQRELDLPMYLLGDNGFTFLEPFVPVEVQPYTPDEFETIMEYYKERKFIREITPSGQLEIALLTAKSPISVLNTCKPL